MAVRRLANADAAATERAQQVMERQLAVMERVVDDLLDILRIRRGAIERRREPFDLRVAVARAVETSRGAFVAQGLTQIVRQAPDALTVDGDPVRLEQVVANLLNNALKYTPRDGRVEITTAALGDEAAVTVRDTGMGIERSLLSGIFDPFVQGSRPLHRPPGGLGIGLTLVRTLVEMHGGRVEAASAGPGHGGMGSRTTPSARGTPDSTCTSSSRSRRKGSGT